MTGEGRLVRDCMIEKIERVTPYTRPVRDRNELLRMLRAKLLEEVAEVLDPETVILEELGDVMQVMIDLAALYGYTVGDIDDARMEKHRQKGGFGTVLAWRQPDE